MSRRSGGDLGKNQRTIRLGPLKLRSELVLLLLCALAIALIWLHQWLGLIACALSAATLSQLQEQPSVPKDCAGMAQPHWGTPADAVSSEPSPPAPDSGAALMVGTVVPVWSRQLAAIQSSVQSGTVELLGSFSSVMGLQDQLSTQIQALSAQNQSPEAEQQLSQLTQIGAEIQTQCENALHGLQFGDRVSQMVEVLHHDSERFIHQLPQMTQAKPADAQAWLAALEATYTTDEQRLFHHGQAPEAQQSKVEYF
ncbi:hypothetical protein [Paucibacter sp. Y2R2-4]|uniref:hypothetical protein n=1 Tax=Paucibacter sp. Y2R2-4 TaxID=2893553 RepID=UPI0021E4D617|nr:hypothetical protein [Paucibacter sp. Y2R2-4]MCV2349984.1 hypothetical protein [Paucibacter sp. Y2R2-4]